MFRAPHARRHRGRQPGAVARLSATLGAGCRSVGDGRPSPITPGRYLYYRGVIREQDILACENDLVRFRLRYTRTGAFAQRCVPGAELLWLILRHVLPNRLRRARNFGFLHPNCKRSIALLQVLLRFDRGGSAPPVRPCPPVRCACCRAAMRIA